MCGTRRAQCCALQTQSFKPMHTPRLLALSATLLLGAAQAATPYAATPFDVPDASSSFLYDINNVGSMVGYATTASGSQSFVVSGGGVFNWLSGPVGSLNTTALGLSDTGVVVGAFSDTQVDDGSGNLVFGPNKGFILDASGYSTVALTGYDETVVRAISPNGRYITGYASNATTWDGWMLDRSTGNLTVIASGLLVIAQGVRDDGVVVGSRIWQPAPATPTQREAFRFEAGVYTAFQLAGQTDTRARALSDDGLLAGWLRNGSDISAFFGSAADYSTVTWSGLQTYAEGLNNAGVGVGAYLDANDNWQALVFNPVPEPATYGLMLGGLGLLGATLRRRSPA